MENMERTLQVAELNWVAKSSGRLSAILREEMKLSAGLMNRLKWREALLVNGVPRHTDFPVEPGDRVTVLMEEPAPDYPAQGGEAFSDL